jgi:hypothetical protein
MIKKTHKLRSSAQSILRDFPVDELHIRSGSRYESIKDIFEAAAEAIRKCSEDRIGFLLTIHVAGQMCNLMIERLSADTGIRAGWIWDAWVQLLHEGVAFYGLPHEVRKDVDKKRPGDPESPFLLLIRELQKHIPTELRRHLSPETALAPAINRARLSDWWSNLLPPELLISPKDLEKGHAEFRDRLVANPNWVQSRPRQFQDPKLVRARKEIEKDIEVRPTETKRRRRPRH